MDDYRFITEIVNSDVARLVDRLSSQRSRDQIAYDLGDRMVSGVRSAQNDIDHSFDPTDPEQVRTAVSNLAQLVDACTLIRLVIDELLLASETVMPLGITHLVHTSLEQGPLRERLANRRLIFHPNLSKGYSVTSVADAFSSITDLLSVLSDADFILGVDATILGVPSTDPDNCLLAPVLAHELAHLLIDEEDVRTDLGALLDELTPIFRYRAADLAARRIIIDDGYERDMSSWLTELACDVMACRFAGPAYIYASAVYLQAAKPLVTSRTHPPTSIRLRTCIEVLKAWGWSQVMEDKAGSASEYLAKLAGRRTEFVDWRAELLVPDHSMIVARLLSVAQRHVAHALLVDQYLDFDRLHELESAMQRGLMPPSLAENPPSPWAIVNAAWFARLAGSSAAEEIAKAASDEPYNRFTTKAIELAGIASLWAAK